MASFLFRLLNNIVAGETQKVKVRGKTRVIPSSWKLVHHNRDGSHHEQRHEHREEYADCERYLIPLAHEALTNGDIEAFFATYCLVSDIEKHSNLSGCFGTSAPKHLDYDIHTGSGPHTLPSDRSADRTMRMYARLMEGFKIPGLPFKTGLGFIIDALPFGGPMSRFIMSGMMYEKTASSVHLPNWFKRKSYSRLIWATAFPLFLPEAGDPLGAMVGTDSGTAHDTAYWIKLRTLLSADIQDEDGLWTSPALAKLFGKYSQTRFDWTYGSKFRKELYPDGNRAHERDSMA